MSNIVVLHFVPNLNAVINSAFLRYKTALFESMADNAEVHILTLDKTDIHFENATIKTYSPPRALQWNMRSFFAKTLLQCKPDVVHIHALWETSAYKLFTECAKQNIPTVITADHKLDKWHLKQGYWLRKLPKLLSNRQHMLSQAGALHFVTEQEYSSFMSFAIFHRPKGGLCLNKRCSIIEPFSTSWNATANDMSHRLLTLYQKVVDSFPFYRMDETERRMEDLFLALGCPHGNVDIQISQEDVSSAKSMSGKSLRRIFLHSSDEGILDYVKAGAKALDSAMPIVEVEKIDRFLPNPDTHNNDTGKLYRNAKAEKIKSDDSMPPFEQNFCALIATILHKTRNGTAHRADFAEICKTLETNEYGEDIVNKKLQELGLLNDAARLLQIMKERYCLSEGFMFTDPVDDKKTGKFRKKLYKSKIQ